MRRSWQIWLTLAGCLAIAVAALGYLTQKALELDRAELAARQQTELEENVRLALWRMDTAAAPIVANESARPWTDYASFVVPIGAKPTSDRTSLPTSRSPLVLKTPAEVLLHFEVAATGALSSPQIVDVHVGKSGIKLPLTSEELAVRTQRFASVQAFPVERLWAAAPETVQNPPLALNPQVPSDSDLAASPQQLEPSQDLSRQAESPALMQQRSRGENEFQARSQIVQNNSISNFRMNAMLLDDSVRLTPMTPVWLEDRLLLVRRIRVGGADRLQGCWLDWPQIRQQLLGQIDDLLPTAQLRPAPATSETTRLLATLPVELIVPATTLVQPADWTPTQLALLAAWVAMGLVSISLLLLMRGILGLSERRAAFVSAVTHELRTPLTTFRMYTEMLLGGMVDAQGRQRYLETLHAEAERLSHLVENVLSYARLERQGASLPLETLSIGDLLSAVEGRLAERTQQADLQLDIEVDVKTRSTQIRTNRLAVEQILSNLVDNACKYGRSSANRTIELSATSGNGHAALIVNDFGPGIAPQQRHKLFEPFHKSAHEAADTAPGVGLGLALSRRLARQMGGDLRFRTGQAAGAGFELVLPTVKQ
jgi:signal transduction histidine kinase